jgi:predicted RNase H-like HicB family nuclease
MATVTFNVDVHEEPDGSYWAEVTELPGCFASGFSLDELREAVFEAIQLWLPDGITLGDPSWTLVDEPKSPLDAKAGQRKTAPRRKMLVCA